MSAFSDMVFSSSGRMGMPIAVHPGVALTRARVRDIVTDPQAQLEASAALHERHKTPVVLSAMDLSAEAEAFGCDILFTDDEVPTVVGRHVTTAEAAKALRVPSPGEKRTRVYLETVRLLKKLAARPLVLAGCIGPFSLAGRLWGLTEALDLTISDPDLMHILLEKSARFLVSYARAFKEAGADGMIMAEPAAGLLSPRSVATFSSAYVRKVVEGAGDGRFSLILHNCAAKPVHLSAILEAGPKVFHFGAPMDIPAALGKTPADIILCGNLDPTSVFCQASPQDFVVRMRALLDATKDYRNYVISSGCDVPARAPLANLDAFYETLRGA